MEAAASLGPFSTSDMLASYAHPPSPSKRDRAVFWLARRAGTALDNQRAQRLDRLSKRFIGRALAIRAIGESIAAVEWPGEEMDPQDQLRAMLDTASSELESRVVAIGSIRVKPSSSALVQAKALCLKSAKVFADELDNLKGIIQAHDANVSALRQVAEAPAMTAEELEQQLDAIFVI